VPEVVEPAGGARGGRGASGPSLGARSGSKRAAVARRPRRMGAPIGMRGEGGSIVGQRSFRYCGICLARTRPDEGAIIASTKTSMKTGWVGGARSSASGGSDGLSLEGGGVTREDGGAGGAGGFSGGGRGGTALGWGVTGKVAPLAIRQGGGLSSGEVGEAPWAGDGVAEGERARWRGGALTLDEF
jgi:hypothetical protein